VLERLPAEFVHFLRSILRFLCYCMHIYWVDSSSFHFAVLLVFTNLFAPYGCRNVSLSLQFPYRLPCSRIQVHIVVSRFSL